MERNWKLVAGSIILLLVIGTISTVIYYRIEQQSVRTILEDADFTVTSFDIFESGENALLARGSAVIETDNATEPLDRITLQLLEITVYNNSEYIASTTVNINNTVFNDGINFEIAIPIESENPSKATTNVLTNIMIGVNFDLDFSAVIYYKFGLFDQSLSFENIIHFRLDQPSMEFSLDYFDLLGPEKAVVFGIFNPFSTNLGVEGQVDVVVNGSVVGSIAVDPITLTSGWNKVNDTFVALYAIDEILGLYFQFIDEPIQLATNLILSFDGLPFSTSPVLDLLGTGLSFEVNFVEITQLNLKTEPIGLDLTANLNITSRLPIDVNITNFSASIYTKETMIGNLTYKTLDPTFVPTNKAVELSGVQFNMSCSLADFMAILSSGRILVGDIRVSLVINSLIHSFDISDQTILFTDFLNIV